MKWSGIRWQNRLFFGGVCVLALTVLWPLVVPVAAGATAAFVSESWVQRLAVAVGAPGRRGRLWICAVFFSSALWALVIIPVILSTGQALRDLTDILRTIDFVSLGGWVDATLLSGVKWLESLGINISVQQIVVRASTLAQSFSEKALNELGNVVTRTPQLVFHLMIFQFSWIVFIVNGKLYRSIIIPILIPSNYARRLVTNVTADVIRGVITANIAVSLVQTFLIILLLVAFSVPRALVWGSLAFFLSFIPLIGTAPVLLGGAVYLFMHNRVVAAICLAASVLIIGTIDNFLRPLFLRGSVELPFFWIFIAFLGGVLVFGFPGVILGPLAFALFAEVIRDIRSRRHSQDPSTPS